MNSIFSGRIEIDADLTMRAQQRWDSRAKPVGSLGQLEAVGIRLCEITNMCPARVPSKPAVAVFAADHGIALAGASKWPQAITAAMASTVATGGAAINSFAAAIGADVSVIDVGIATDADLPGVIDAKISGGTRDISVETAMSVEDASAAYTAGYRHAETLIKAGYDCLIGGELGIGNTAVSAAIIAAVTGHGAAEVTGAGAGIPQGGIEHKVALIDKAVTRYNETVESRRGSTVESAGLELLSQLGGYEIGALAGFYSCAAKHDVVFIIDGVISLAALAIADAQIPGVASVAIAGHRSSEPAASIALDHFGLEPLVDLELRLGEGTGAALAFNLVKASALALRDMAEIPAI